MDILDCLLDTDILDCGLNMDILDSNFNKKRIFVIDSCYSIFCAFCMNRLFIWQYFIVYFNSTMGVYLIKYVNKFASQKAWNIKCKTTKGNRRVISTSIFYFTFDLFRMLVYWNRLFNFQFKVTNTDKICCVVWWYRQILRNYSIV